MRALVTPFLLGCAAIGALLAVGALALGIVADANGWDSFRISVGPLNVLAFERSGDDTATAFGPGLAAIALAGGLLNAVAAAFLRRRGS